MHKIDGQLSPDLQKELTAIRRSLGDRVSATGRAQRWLQMLDDWLLDNEQRQVMLLPPENTLLMVAAIWLLEAGSNDGAPLERQAAAVGQWIMDQWPTLGIRDHHRAGELADVCHRVSDQRAAPHVSNRNAPALFANAKNPELAAAALDLAHRLDLVDPSFIHRIAGRLDAEDRQASTRWEDSYDLLAIGPHPSYPATIRIGLRCRHPQMHRALKHYETGLKHHLQALNRSVTPRFLYADVRMEIETVGYAPIDLKFEVDSSAALQLFMGNRLYKDKRVFLRELVQNAVDACGLRKLAEPGYDARISLKVNPDISVITIRDNGIGMDRQWIEKYFLNVGISFYQSSDIRRLNRHSDLNFSFISQFGIGFLSSFLVADKIVVRSRKAAGKGLMITITSLKDYFDVQVLGTDFPVGTEVTLHLKPSTVGYCRHLEYIGYLKTNLRFLNVPVTLHDDSGKVTTIGREKLIYDSGSAAEPAYIAPLNLPHSEGYLLLKAKHHGASIYALETAKGGVSIFQDGIFVTQLESLLPDGARGYVVGRINFVGPDKFELSMDRNRIFWTEAQRESIMNSVRHALITIANRLMTTAESQAVSENTQRSLVNHLSTFFDINDMDDAMHDRLCGPVRQVVEKRFRDFVRIHFAHTLRSDHVPEADGYSETWQRRVIEKFAKRRRAPLN